MRWLTFATLLVLAVVLVVDGTNEGAGRTSRRNRRATGTGAAQAAQGAEIAPTAPGSRRNRQSTTTGSGKRAGSRRGRLLEKAGIHRTTVDMSAYFGEWLNSEPNADDEEKFLKGLYSKITFSSGNSPDTYTLIMNKEPHYMYKLENFRLRQGRDRITEEDRVAGMRDGTIVSHGIRRGVASYEFYIDELHPHQLRCDVTEAKLGELPFDDKWIFELSTTSAKDDTLTVVRRFPLK